MRCEEGSNPGSADHCPGVPPETPTATRDSCSSPPSASTQHGQGNPDESEAASGGTGVSRRSQARRRGGKAHLVRGLGQSPSKEPQRFPFPVSPTPYTNMETANGKRGAQANRSLDFPDNTSIKLRERAQIALISRSSGTPRSMSRSMSRWLIFSVFSGKKSSYCPKILAHFQQDARMPGCKKIHEPHACFKHLQFSMVDPILRTTKCQSQARSWVLRQLFEGAAGPRINPDSAKRNRVPFSRPATGPLDADPPKSLYFKRISSTGCQAP
jgi:hypothetical protein